VAFERVFRDGDTEVFGVRESGAPGARLPIVLDASSPDVDVFFPFADQSWSRAALDRDRLIARGEGASLLVPSIGEVPAVMTLDAASESGAPVAVFLNEWRLGEITPGPRQSGHRLAIPPAAWSRPVNEIRFLPVPGRPPGRTPIGRTGVSVPVALEAESQSFSFGGNRTGRFRVGGASVESRERGYVLALLEPSGTLGVPKVFDTFRQPEPGREAESPAAALAAYVRSLPGGSVVLGAVVDDASMGLTEDAVKALASLGSGVDLRGRFRQSHAFIGVAGAPPGSVPEWTDPLRSRVTAGDELLRIARIRLE
jgi:hypothetical protein